MWDDRQLSLIPGHYEERMVIMRLMAAFMQDAESFAPLSAQPRTNVSQTLLTNKQDLKFTGRSHYFPYHQVHDGWPTLRSVYCRRLRIDSYSSA